MPTFFLLMVLTIDYGWGIAPIQGNPFATMYDCLTTIEDIKRKHPTRLHNIIFIELECVTREKNYLKRKDNEPSSQNRVTVDIF